MVIGSVCQIPRIFTMSEVPIGVEVEAKGDSNGEFLTMEEYKSSSGILKKVRKKRNY